MNLFVYGTLRSAALREAVAGGVLEARAATLLGYALRSVVGDIVPTICKSLDDQIDGLVLMNINARQFERLNLYEGAFYYTLTDVTVKTDDGNIAAQVYLPPAGQKIGTKAWSLGEWQDTHERPGVYAATELFARDPMPTMAQVRALFPMIEKRAWAKHRATARSAPSEIRHSARADDAAIVDKGPVRGDFYAIQGMQITHRQFAGGYSDPLQREVFIGVDAALVLPYDPVRDCILLVEQIRMGPLAVGEPNPWSLEPIAGMVDARETPRQAALREAQEEAALSDLDLRHIASFYPSPGSATDYFHAYLGLCDLSAKESYHGGLESENEDLRLHTLSFKDVMAVAETGEINAGPLLLMLHWLAGQRDTLRAGSA